MKKSIYVYSFLSLLYILIPACTGSSTNNTVAADVHVQDSSAKNIISFYGSFNYGKVVKHQNSSETFTISYSGTTDLELTGTPKAVISGKNANEFTVTTQPTSPISPNNSSTFTIVFAPESTGVKDAKVTISNNDIDEDPFVFVVKGTGFEAKNYDFNGDDFPDVIVSATGDDTGGAASGSVSIFFGKYSWNSRIFEADADVKIIGEDISDGFGTSIYSAGDINNDGIDDIIVGAPEDDDGGNISGVAFIFFGKQNWNSVVDASEADVKLIGEDAEDRFGKSVSTAGDVNNDGIDDIIVGAFHDADGGYRSGCAFIFYGRQTWDTIVDAADADVKLIGEGTENNFGSSVSSAGDMNNDGYYDVIVGAHEDDDGGDNSGCAFIFFGGQNMSTSIDASNADVKLIGEDAEDEFGMCVSSAGDVNWDHFDDVIIGAPYDDDGGTDSGCAFIFFGSPTLKSSIDASNADVKLIGDNDEDLFGKSVSSAGDIKNDGYDEVIVGAYNNDDVSDNSGSAYIFNGKQIWSSSINAADANTKLVGESWWNCFGWSVSCAGDVNNDGYDDIIIGAYRDNDQGHDAGSAYIFFVNQHANPTVLEAIYANVKLLGGVTFDYFGSAVGGGE